MDYYFILSWYKARYFKTMLREAKHLNNVKKLKIAERELSPLIPSYEVSVPDIQCNYYLFS